MDLSLKIDTLDVSESEKFQNEYYKRQIPVIIKGLVKQNSSASAWNLEYMQDKLGDTEVIVYDNTLNSSSAYTKGNYTMKFSEFVNVIRKDQDCNIRLFLFNAFKHRPELQKEFPCPSMFKGILQEIGFMFFGGKNTHVRMHFDIDMSSVLHTQFEGRKKVILVSPEFNNLMYKTPLNTYSIADFNKMDFTKFPGLKYVKAYELTLHPGDTLFIPEGYWHYMVYLEGGFGVAYRKIASSFKHACIGLNYLTLKLWLDKCLNFLWGKKWVKLKNEIAFRRADREIQKIKNTLQSY